MNTAPKLNQDSNHSQNTIASILERLNVARNNLLSDKLVAFIAIAGILLHLLCRFVIECNELQSNLPLYFALVFGGIPMLLELLEKIARGRFSSDILAGISIATSVVLGEYLAGTLVVLMLSGGEALEEYAVARAKDVLTALANRMPAFAHLRTSSEQQKDIPISEVQIGMELLIHPHEICPVDGEVLDGQGWMDESFLTGEPFRVPKTPGTEVISGALNGEALLVIRAKRIATDSRYAKIMQVMKLAEEKKPQIRRLGDSLGAYYTPIAVIIAILAWYFSDDAHRFLSVLVVATPCPLLIAIPVSIIGSISLAARRGIIIKDPGALELIDTCRTIIFDKTGTLTYGVPKLEAQIAREGLDPNFILQLVASLEQYSKHPLAQAILAAAKDSGAQLLHAEHISEPPGQGLTGKVSNHSVIVTSRSKVSQLADMAGASLPPQTQGLECVVAVDGKYAATYQFHDAARSDSKSFVQHLTQKHKFSKIMIVSGDRTQEVKHLAEQVGISEIYGDTSPEGKVEIVTREEKLARTIFVGDGINDAPALMSATVGIALGQNSDITSEAASAVVLDPSLAKVDEVFHIARRMRSIALQSAVGGMALSVVGMGLAAVGLIGPVAGALFQEIIDVVAILNALRTAFKPAQLRDYE